MWTRRSTTRINALIKVLIPRPDLLQVQCGRGANYGELSASGRLQTAKMPDFGMTPDN